MRKIVSLLALLLAGCATSVPPPARDNITAKGFARPAPGALVVLIPPPDVQGFEAGQRQLMTELDLQLQAAGYRVAALTRANCTELWGRFSTEVGGMYDPATGAPRNEAIARALSSLARTVCEEARCDLLLMPSLLRRAATLEGTHAEWDGVRHPIRFKDGFQLATYRASGTTAALSVGVMALARDGTLAFTRYGGASLVFMTNVREARLEPRKDLFADRRPSTSALGLAWHHPRFARHRAKTETRSSGSWRP